MCGGFIIAWFPYACFSLWSAFGDTSAIPIWLTPLPVILAKTSIAYNPLIYVTLTDRYRYLHDHWNSLSKALLTGVLHFVNCVGRCGTGSTSRKPCTFLHSTYPSIHLSSKTKVGPTTASRGGSSLWLVPKNFCNWSVSIPCALFPP